MNDKRQFSPATARNRDAVRDAFLAHMPQRGVILEIASGSGEHGVHITEKAPDLDWIFTDHDAQYRESQKAWMEHLSRPGLQGPLVLDASAADWGARIEALRPDGLFCANMIHIAPFEVCEGLFAGAGRLLRSGGKLFIYGPYRRHGEQTAPSNAAFEDWLQAQDSRYGVRDLESEILPLADRNTLRLAHVIDMPANNFSLVFEKI